MSIMLNMAVSAAFCYMLSLLANKGMLEHSLPTQAVVYALSAIGAILFDTHEHMVWLLLMFHTYTDMTGMFVYYRLTLCAAFMELLFIMLTGRLMENSVAGLFAALLLVWMFGLTKAAHGADAQVLAMIVIYGFGRGYAAVPYCAYMIALSCTCFLVYMAARNLPALVRGDMDRIVANGPFLPGISAAFLLASAL